MVTKPLREKCSSQHSWEEKHAIWEVLGKDSEKSKQRQFPQVWSFLSGTIPMYSYEILPRSNQGQNGVSAKRMGQDDGAHAERTGKDAGTHAWRMRKDAGAHYQYHFIQNCLRHWFSRPCRAAVDLSNTAWKSSKTE